MVSVRRRSSLSLRLVLSLLALLLVPVAVPGSPVAAERVRVLVEATGLDAAVAAVEAHQGSVAEVLPRFGVAIADVPADRVALLTDDTRVSSVIADERMRTSSSTFDATSGRAASATINAPALWQEGITGAGVTVAVVDTGVAEHPDLGTRLVAVVDVTGDRLRGDGHGHGTFMAGLVAGDGASGGAATGIAPHAEIVSVKIADRDGNTSLSQVLAGLHAVGELAEPLGIDVVLLALGTEAPGRQDPVGAALARLWGQGLFVVVAAGNEGPEPGSISTPGRDPYLMTVGAVDDRGSAGHEDDVVPTWSSVGGEDLRTEKPEVVAPGVSVVSLRARDSLIDRSHPGARVGEDHFRGSGTSMSAAVTAGAAALLLEALPGLTPDQLKGRLMAGAAPAPSDAFDGSAGYGVVDVAGALVADDAAPGNGDLPPAPRGGDAAPSRSGQDSHSQHTQDHAPAAWHRGTDGDWTGWVWRGWVWRGWVWRGWVWRGWVWRSSDWTTTS